MTDYSDYFEDFDEYYNGDYSEFEDIDDFIDFLQKRFRPQNSEEWSKRSWDSWETQAEQFLLNMQSAPAPTGYNVAVPTGAAQQPAGIQPAPTLPRRRRVNLVQTANNIYASDTTNLTLTETRRKHLQSASQKINANQKLSKVEHRERLRLVQFRAKEIKQSSNLNHKQAMKEAWKQFRRD